MKTLLDNTYFCAVFSFLLGYCLFGDWTKSNTINIVNLVYFIITMFLTLHNYKKNSDKKKPKKLLYSDNLHKKTALNEYDNEENELKLTHTFKNKI